jgi:hypothetical protein
MLNLCKHEKNIEDICLGESLIDFEVSHFMFGDILLKKDGVDVILSFSCQFMTPIMAVQF